ncbi:MAG: FtsX-like permease family protein [Candidatus Dormibacteria bacterium]
MRAAWILFRGLNLEYFRGHALRIGLTVVGIALGVMLLFGAIIDNASAGYSIARRTQSLQGQTDLEVTTAALAGVPEGLAARARGMPGVAAAAAVLQQHVFIRGPRSAVEVVAIGYDPGLARLAPAAVDPKRLRRLRDGPGLVVAPQLLTRLGLSTNDRLSLVAQGVAHPLPVVAVMPAEVGQQVDQGRVVALPLPLLQAYVNAPSRVSSIFIGATDRSRGGISALRERLVTDLGTSVQVLDADHVRRELDISTAQFRSVTNLLSLLALLLGGYVVFITMSMAAVERRREFSIMLALGDSAARLLARFLAEAALLGLAGSLVGLVAGYYVGRYLAGGVPPYLEQAYGFHSEVAVPASGVAAALLAGILASVAAATGPALGILRLPPAEALRAQPLGEAPRRGLLAALAFIAGCGLLAGGLAGALLVPRVGYIFAGFTFLGAVLALPEVFTRALRFAAVALERWRWRWGAGVVRVVAANLQGNPRRTVAAISAAALSLSLVIGFAGSNDDVTQAVDRFASHFSRVDLVANGSDNLYLQLPFPAAAVTRVRALPGVAAAYPITFNFLNWHGRRIAVLSQEPASRRAFDLDFAAGNPDRAYASLSGSGLLISTQVAQLDGIRLGDTVTLGTPAGDRQFHVSGIVEDLGWQEGVLIMGRSAFVSAYRQPEVNQVLVKLLPGMSAEAVRGAIHRELGDESVVQPGTASIETVRRANAAIEAPFTHMRNVSVVVAVLAVLNTLLVAVLQRRREIGVLIAIGLHRRQLAEALLAEAGVMVALALLAGTALGLTIQAVGIIFLDATTGLPLHFHLQPAALGIGLVAALVIAVAGSLYPARQAATVPVLEAIAYE